MVKFFQKLWLAPRLWGIVAAVFLITQLAPPPSFAQVYVYDCQTLDPLAQPYKSSSENLASSAIAANTGDYILITNDTSIGSFGEGFDKTLTIASGTVNDDGTGAVSTEVRTLTNTGRGFLSKPGACTVSLNNLKISNITPASASHGLLIFNPTGSIKLELNNVTIDNLNGNGGFGDIAYWSSTNITLTAIPNNSETPSYTISNCTGAAGPFYQNNATGTTGLILDGTGKGVFTGNYIDAAVNNLTIKGGGTYEFGTGTMSWQNTSITGNSKVTYKPTTGLIANTNLTLSDSSLTIEGGSEITVKSNFTLNGTANFSIKNPAKVDINQVTANNGTFSVENNADITINKWASGNGVVFNKTGSNSVELTNLRWMKGTLNLDEGSMTLTGAPTSTNDLNLKAAAGTTFNYNASGALNLLAASESSTTGSIVNNADINVGSTGTMTINGTNDNIKPRNFTKASSAKLNTNGNTMTVSGKLDTGNHVFEMSNGGTLGVNGNDVGSTTEMTTLTLKGGTLKANLSHESPITITADSAIPVSDNLYFQLDASSGVTTKTITDGTGTNVKGVLAWQKSAGSAADFKSSYNTNTATGVVLQNNNQGNATYPTEAYLPLLVSNTNELGGKPYIQFDGNHFFRFSNTSDIQSAFWVVKDLGSSQSFLLGEDGKSKSYHFHRGNKLPDGTYAIFGSYTVGNDVKSGEADLQLNGAEVTDPTTTGIPANEWSLISLSSESSYTANTFSKDRNQVASKQRTWQGSVAEVILFNDQLTETEVAMMNAYLDQKWSLGLGLNNTFEQPTARYTLDVAESAKLDVTGLDTVGFEQINIKPGQTLEVQQDQDTIWHTIFDNSGALKFNGSLELAENYIQNADGTLILDIFAEDDYSQLKTSMVASLLNAGDEAATLSLSIADGFTVTRGMYFDVLTATEGFSDDTDVSVLNIIDNLGTLLWDAALIDNVDGSQTLRLTSLGENNVPEPSTWVMMLLGGLGLLYFRRARR
ncbi:MAG: PEP-CTERM sorting domain-containing protein [Planctomycetia bacterium]|nr:PEP-CTERM sorting domain-containing protein [Planctomycetia bacterium]